MANLKLAGNTFDAVHMGKFLNSEFGESVNTLFIIINLVITQQGAEHIALEQVGSAVEEEHGQH
jgi:hypothetical protein